MSLVLSYLRTTGVVVVLVLFPHLTEMLMTVILRLVCRALVALFSRIVTEMGREVQGLLMQASIASSSFEDALVHCLDAFVGGGWSSAMSLNPGPVTQPTQVPVETTSSSSSTSPTIQCPHGGVPPHTSPWDFATFFLLVVDMTLRRAWGGAGS